MNTVANQKVVIISKNSYKSDFLQIGIAEWQEACKVLSPAAFKLYLYLASNANGFKLALSQVAVENAIGISKSSYHRAVKELEEKGYLIHKSGNAFIFYCASPKNGTHSEKAGGIENEEYSKNEKICFKNETNMSQNQDLVSSNLNREIDNINNTNKINKEKNEGKGTLSKESKELLTKINEDMIADKFDEYDKELLTNLNIFIRENLNNITAAEMDEEIISTFEIVYGAAA